jgi:hypothetical protein
MKSAEKNSPYGVWGVFFGCISAKKAQAKPHVFLCGVGLGPPCFFARRMFPCFFRAIPAHLCIAKKGENCYTLIY